MIWGETLSKLDTLVEISNKYNGVIKTDIAIKHGVSRATLSMYCKQNKIRRIEMGSYVLVEGEQDRYYALMKSAEKIVFSHDTALYLNHLLAEEPVKPSVTIISGFTPSVLVNSSSVVFYIKRDLADLGKISVKTPYGNEVYVYDKERAVCDMVRSYKRIGKEKVLKALRKYALREDRDMKKLFRYAEAFRISVRLYTFWKEAKLDFSVKAASEGESDSE